MHEATMLRTVAANRGISDAFMDGSHRSTAVM